MLDSRLSVMSMDLGRKATIEAMAESVLAQAPPRFALAGFSMGGQVALEVWARAPERVSRLALMSTNPKGLTLVVQKHIAHAIERVKAEGLEGYLADAFPLYFPDSFDSFDSFDSSDCDSRDARDRLQDIYIGMANRLGTAVAVRQMHALLSYAGVGFDLATIDCPTAVICGARDARTPPSLHADMAARVPDARLQVIEGSGHFTLLEAPAAVAKALSDWLKR